MNKSVALQLRLVPLRNAVQKYRFFLNYPNNLITFAKNQQKNERQDPSVYRFALGLRRSGPIGCELYIHSNPLRLASVCRLIPHCRRNVGNTIQGEAQKPLLAVALAVIAHQSVNGMTHDAFHP